MRSPGLANLRLHMGETGARGWTGNADEMLASGTLDLPAGVARVAFQRLIAVGTIEFEFICVHRLLLHHAQSGCEKYMKDLSILSVC
jgi:hypothetical protein